MYTKVNLGYSVTHDVNPISIKLCPLWEEKKQSKKKRRKKRKIVKRSSKSAKKYMYNNNNSNKKNLFSEEVYVYTVYAIK